MEDDSINRKDPINLFKSRELFIGRQNRAPGETFVQKMFSTKKIIETTGGNPNEKTTHSVVTKTVEKTGGVHTTTRTLQNCPEDGIDAALKRLDIDPKKFHSGGTSVTKTIVYTDSSGKREVIEETVETYGDPDKLAKEARQQKNVFKEFKDDSKTDAQKIASCLGKDFCVPQQQKIDKKPGSSTVSDGSVQTGKFLDDCLKAHNEYRFKHGVPELVLSKELCAYSQQWADHLAATDTFKHRVQDKRYGENIYMKWSSDPNHMITGKEPVDSWYSEIKYHVFGKEPRSLKSGHFTQVIWKSSKHLGCAWSRSKSGKILVVANYDPPGNYIGKFAENVPPPKH